MNVFISTCRVRCVLSAQGTAWLLSQVHNCLVVAIINELIRYWCDRSCLGKAGVQPWLSPSPWAVTLQENISSAVPGTQPCSWKGRAGTGWSFGVPREGGAVPWLDPASQSQFWVPWSPCPAWEPLDGPNPTKESGWHKPPHFCLQVHWFGAKWAREGHKKQFESKFWAGSSEQLSGDGEPAQDLVIRFGDGEPDLVISYFQLCFHGQVLIYFQNLLPESIQFSCLASVVMYLHSKRRQNKSCG